MFEVYAAEVQFHVESTMRERALRRRAQRAERTQRMSSATPLANRWRRTVTPTPVTPTPVTPQRAAAVRGVGGWPRPIALHA
jgi:hypothetical protein